MSYLIKQRTIKNTISATGIGIHTGIKIHMTLRPAPANTGIVFRRVDCSPSVEIAANTNNIGDTTLSSCLVKNNVRISTIEHLMAALAGLSIDNIYVDVNAPEIPIMDGSASPFVFLIQSAGIEEQAASKSFNRITKKIEIRENDKYVKIEPYDGFKVSFSIGFDHPFFRDGRQESTLDFSSMSFVKEVSRARTFGFLSDFESLRTKKLAMGGNLDNVIVIDDYKVINEDGLRYHDECVKHKILDAIGDLYLLGGPIIGAFTGCKSGHALNNKLLKALIADSTALERITFQESKDIPKSFLQIAALEA